jgi:hypothetical protein
VTFGELHALLLPEIEGSMHKCRKLVPRYEMSEKELVLRQAMLLADVVITRLSREGIVTLGVSKPCLVEAERAAAKASGLKCKCGCD